MNSAYLATTAFPDRMPIGGHIGRVEAVDGRQRQYVGRIIVIG